MLIARSIVFRCVAFIMLCTIKLNDQIRRRAVKIYNVTIDHKLPMKARLYIAKKLIPKFLFFLGHILA